jgi:hypothetical protein
VTIRIGDDISGLDFLSSLNLNRPGLSFLNHDLLYKGIKGNLPTVGLIVSEKKLRQGLHPFVFDVIKVPLYGPHDRTCTGKNRGALTGTKGEEVF